MRNVLIPFLFLSVQLFGQISDANFDAFSRLRVSDPTTIFSVQSQYDNNPLLMQTDTTGTGVVSYSTDTRMVKLSATAGTGTAFTQSYQYLPYQPGKSQLIKITGVLDTAVADATVDVGYFDANNGIFLRQNGTAGYQIIRRTKTNGSVSEEIVDHADWNLNRFADYGTIRTRYNLDENKAFILIIDLQFLGMGRVRVGFDIDGDILYAHEFLNANVLNVPYMQTATLPIQMLLTADSTLSTKDCYFKCAAVESEGGISDVDAFTFSTPEVTETAASGARTHLLSLRPKTTYKGITNRMRYQIASLNMIATGASPVYWELVVGASNAASTWDEVDTIYSSLEYTTVRGAYSSMANGIVIASGYISGAGSGASSPPTVTNINVDRILSDKYPITLNRAGAVRSLGTLSLLVKGIGGASATRASITYKEVR